MGLLIDTNSDVVGIEARSESVYLTDIQATWTSNGMKSEHIFCYEDGCVEISKEFLLKLLEFLDNEQHRKDVIYSHGKNVS